MRPKLIFPDNLQIGDIVAIGTEVKNNHKAFAEYRVEHIYKTYKDGVKLRHLHDSSITIKVSWLSLHKGFWFSFGTQARLMVEEAKKQHGHFGLKHLKNNMESIRWGLENGYLTGISALSPPTETVSVCADSKAVKRTGEIDLNYVSTYRNRLRNQGVVV